MSEHVVRLHWAGDKQPTWIDFFVYPVVTYDSDGNREFCIGEDIADGITADIERAHHVCNGFVKWDGCTQIYFTEQGPQLHFDDADSMRQFFECLTFARARAVELMPEEKS
jgi:hypothetical protein